MGFCDQQRYSNIASTLLATPCPNTLSTQILQQCAHVNRYVDEHGPPAEASGFVQEGVQASSCHQVGGSLDACACKYRTAPEGHQEYHNTGKHSIGYEEVWEPPHAHETECSVHRERLTATKGVPEAVKRTGLRHSMSLLPDEQDRLPIFKKLFRPMLFPVTCACC
jgi:hypothetical protein